jgi:hypothetical protein
VVAGEGRAVIAAPTGLEAKKRAIHCYNLIAKVRSLLLPVNAHFCPLNNLGGHWRQMRSFR